LKRIVRYSQAIPMKPYRPGLASAIFCASIATILGCGIAAAAERFPGTTWERVDPAVAGWAADRLAKAEAWSKRIDSTSVMVVHHGAVVAEWGDTAAKTPLASVRKSLLSALIGIAVARGQIDLSQSIGALYSSSEWGPGYGYLWWTGPINSGAAPAANLPDGTFFAQGLGGQFAFVIPAHDLVVVHRGAHIEGGLANLRTVGRLLWLILDAGKFPDIGPDASLEAAQGIRADGDLLSRTLTGKTLLYGEAAARGPHRIRLNADGTAAVLRGKEPTELDTGSWSIRENELCREWKKSEPRQRCMAAVIAGSKVQLFDRMGLMLIEARVVEE
jgi:CubicO group peptidase (beta-lactamase class C family)